VLGTSKRSVMGRMAIRAAWARPHGLEQAYFLLRFHEGNHLGDPAVEPRGYGGPGRDMIPRRLRGRVEHGVSRVRKGQLSNARGRRGWPAYFEAKPTATAQPTGRSERRLDDPQASASDGLRLRRPPPPDGPRLRWSAPTMVAPRWSRLRWSAPPMSRASEVRAPMVRASDGPRLRWSAPRMDPRLDGPRGPVFGSNQASSRENNVGCV